MTVDKTTPNDDEKLDSQESQSEVEELLDNVEDDDVREKLGNHIKTLNIQRRKKAEKLTLLEKAKAEAEAEAEKPKESTSTEVVNNPDEKISKLELKIDGYSDDEIDFIQKNGGKDALTNPLVVSAIEAQREKKKADDASIEGSPKSTIHEKYSKDEIDRMPLDKLEQLLPRD